MRVRALIVLLVLSACTGTTSPTSRPASTATPPARLTVAHPTVWLCQPATTDDPCDTPLATTAVHPDGSTTVERVAAPSQPVDCFYVYPTVSQAATTNAPLRAEEAERSTAVAQAAAFSRACRVYAPVYRQLTVKALFAGKYFDVKARALAHGDVVSAFHDYLNHNPTRRFVLIGHSQGSFELQKLLQEEVDGDAALRARLVSALLIGGNLKVPHGKPVGGDLQRIPLCTQAKQNGCVISYNTYDTTPPADALFGRPDPARNLVGACTNPAALGGGTAPLHPLLPSSRALPGAPAVTTTFISYPGLATGTCKEKDGEGWLQVDAVVPGTRPLPKSLGPAWGLHLIDVNVALGDLVDLVRAQSV